MGEKLTLKPECFVDTGAQDYADPQEITYKQLSRIYTNRPTCSEVGIIDRTLPENIQNSSWLIDKGIDHLLVLYKPTSHTTKGTLKIFQPYLGMDLQTFATKAEHKSIDVPAGSDSVHRIGDYKVSYPKDTTSTPSKKIPQANCWIEVKVNESQVIPTKRYTTNTTVVVADDNQNYKLDSKQIETPCPVFLMTDSGDRIDVSNQISPPLLDSSSPDDADIERANCSEVLTVRQVHDLSSNGQFTTQCDLTIIYSGNNLLNGIEVYANGDINIETVISPP